MARTIKVEILGDASKLQRSFGQASRSAKKFDHDIGSSARGALAASVSFKGLGRSISFASASFLGGAGLVYAFKQVVSEASRVQEETEKTGVVFGENAKQVQAWSMTLSESFGVGEGAALQAAGQFGNMLRPLGFGTKAAAGMSEQLVQLAADMASFNNAKPADVLKALSSGLAGQVRPLRQYGVFLSQDRIKQEALTDGIAKNAAHLTQAQKVQAAYNIILKDTKNAQGDVARNTGSLSVAMSKLTAGVQDTEAGLASALLPTITEYVNKAGAWLNNTKNQQRVQKDFTGTLRVATSVVRGVTGAVKAVTGAVGGVQSALEILVSLKVASVLVRWAGAGSKFAHALRDVAAAEKAVAAGNVATEVTAVGGAAEGAAGSTRRLALALKALNTLKFGAITAALGGIIYLFEQIREDSKKTTVLGPTGSSGQNSVIERDGEFFKITRTAGRGPSAAKLTRITAAQANAMTGTQPLPMGGSPVPHYPGAVKGAAGSRPRRPLSMQGRLNLALLAVAQASATKGSGDDVTALQNEASILRKLIAGGGTLAEQTDRNSQLGGVLSQIDSLTAKAATAAKKKRGKAKKAQQFTEPFALLLAEAKAGATKTTADDLKAEKALRAWTQKMIKGQKLKGQALIDAWNEIARLNDAIAGAQGAVTNKIAKTSSRLITAGLGLNRAQRLALESRISQAEAHNNRVPRNQVGALGQTVSIETVHVHGVQNPKQLIDALQKHAKRGAASTRGTHGGSYLGLH